MLLRLEQRCAYEKNVIVGLSSTSDVIFPRPSNFPENMEFPGIQSKFPGIPRNPLKASVSPDLWGVISKISCLDPYFEPIFGHINAK